MGLIRAKQREEITSQLPSLFQILPRTSLTFFKPVCTAGSCSAWGPSGLQCHFYQATFQTVSPQHSLVHGAVPSQWQDLVNSFAELHEGPADLFLQPAEVPLNSSHTHLVCQAHLLILYCLLNLLRVHSFL